MSLNERFQMKTVMSYANAADIASYSQIFSKLAPCQRPVLGERALVKVCQIKKWYNNASLLQNLTDHYISLQWAKILSFVFGCFILSYSSIWDITFKNCFPNFFQHKLLSDFSALWAIDISRPCPSGRNFDPGRRSISLIRAVLEFLKWFKFLLRAGEGRQANIACHQVCL